MKKTYLILFFLIAGIALYSVFSSYKREDRPGVPETVSPEGLKLNNPSAEGINPEHGMPGHRCDIMVGAPLPAAAGSTPVSAPKEATILQTAPASPAPAAAVKINPAHGQPGHRCDLNVGDPLP